MALSLPSLQASSISRASELMPETPSIPDCLFITVSISSGVNPSFFMTYVTIAGSISPQRVPIITPANGVKPMDVLIDFPPSTAVIDAPFRK